MEIKYINLTDEVEIHKLNLRIEEVRENKIEENKQYDVKDFAMVRTTNFITNDHILKPIGSVPFVLTNYRIARYAISKILRKINNISFNSNEEELAKIRKEEELYTPLSSQYRSTIHFTLNGLVSSHSKGNFDNQNFIIIEKLDKHLGKENFRSIRMEDTFASGNFNLSNEAIILINKNKYETLINQNPWLLSYNVVLFDGDEKDAVNYILLEIGIVPENIETNSAEMSDRTILYEEELNKIANVYNLSREKHRFTEEYSKDDEKNLILWKLYDEVFYNELFKYFNISDDEKNKLKYILEMPSFEDSNKVETFEEFILKIGLEKYKNFVIEFNQKIQNLILSGDFPTNDEILNNPSLLSECINNESIRKF